MGAPSDADPADPADPADVQAVARTLRWAVLPAPVSLEQTSTAQDVDAPPPLPAASPWGWWVDGVGAVGGGGGGDCGDGDC